MNHRCAFLILFLFMTAASLDAVGVPGPMPGGFCEDCKYKCRLDQDRCESGCRRAPTAEAQIFCYGQCEAGYAECVDRDCREECAF